METITIPKAEYDKLVNENKTLRNTKLYRKLLQTNQELKKKVYSRKDLGF